MTRSDDLQDATGTALPGPVRPDRPPRRRRRRVRRAALILLGVVVLLTAVAAPSYLAALRRPGTDSVAARTAEWARTHGFSRVVDTAERLSYDIHPPKTGGVLSGGIPPVPARPAAVVPAPTDADAPLPAPHAVAPFSSPALPQEGQWSTWASVGRGPAIRVTYLRPDAVHTSYLVGVVWMDPHLLRFALHPGQLDPGGSGWGKTDTVPAGDRSGLLAAFNSGFRLYASKGGYYENGRTAVPLRDGAASVVIYRDGSATVGVWGRDVRMGADVEAVRQNLAPVVLGGAPVAGLTANVQHQWGATIGNAYYVARSGIGVTRSGALVYAGGPSLSVASLAALLVRAGAVTAMELDINPDWVHLSLFAPGADPSSPTPQKLLPSMVQPAARYYQPVSRDFFSVSAR